MNTSDDTGPTPWMTIENGVHLWVRTAAGLDAAHVMWGGKGAPSGALANERFVSIRITDIRDVGNDWQRVKRNPDGSISHFTEGPRVVTLALRCYNGDLVGKNTTIATLGRVKAWARTPAMVQLFRRSRFGVLDRVENRARIVDAVRSTLLDPYALLEIELSVPHSIEIPGSVIDHVNVTVTSGTAGEIMVLDHEWVPGPPGFMLAERVDDVVLVAAGSVS